MQKKLITINQELTKKMKKAGITCDNMAAMIGLSGAAFSQRKHARTPWELEKCYAIMDILGLPRSDIAKYFADSDGNFEENSGSTNDAILVEMLALQQKTIDVISKIQHIKRRFHE